MIRLSHPLFGGRKLIFAPLLLAPFFGCNCDDTSFTQVGSKISVPELIDFGDVLVGQIDKAQLEVKNEGDANISVTRIQLADDFAGTDYQFVIPTAAFDISAHDSVMIEVKFQPFAVTSSVVGSSFTILTDTQGEDGNPLMAEVAVRGRGVLDALSIMPNPVDFGTVIIGGFEERDFMVKNLLSNPVDLLLRPGAAGESAVLNRSGNGLFEITSPVEPDGSLLPPGMRLAAGETVAIHTRYTPNTMPLPEEDKARAKIAACAESVCDQNVDFIGRASLSGISCTPASLDFGAINPGRRLNKEVTCKNDANHPLNILGWSLAMGTATEFTADAYNGIPSMLGAGEMFTIKTTFSPVDATLALGVVRGELTVNAQTLEGANLRDVRIEMQGSAGGPGISVAPSQLAFGNIALGTTAHKRILVSNIGYSVLTISSVQIGDAVYNSGGGPTTINAGDSQTWDVYFTPLAAQNYNSAMVIVSDDPITPMLSVSLTGIGVALPPCQYTITPSALTWGIVQANQSETQTLSINNVGSDVCLLNDFEIIPQGAEFHLVNGAETGIMLPAGMSKDVPIAFAPTIMGPQAAEFTFYISDPINTNPRVQLSGLGLPPCGNGVVDPGEDCDDGNPFNGDGCDANCTFPGCGNNIIDPGEQCDDGNLISGDGCEPGCTRTGTCGNLILEIGEDCDDGNLMPYDGCDPLCYIEDCGNGVLDPGEACDDGNRANGDGCSRNCTLDTVPNVDVLTFGLGGMRGYSYSDPITGAFITVPNGVGTINVAGVTGPVSMALLFWAGPTNSNDFLANATVNFNGTYVTGVNTGFSSDNCWGFQNSQAYRADVTGLVIGDGAYILGDFVKPGVDVNGVSLVVFYDDGNATNNFDIGIFDSNDSNFSSAYDPADWNGTYMVPNFTLGGSAYMELHVGDGQNFVDGSVIVNGTTIVADGQNFDGNSVPISDAMAASIQNGGLWDIHRYDITSVMTGGPQSLNMTSPLNNDCLSLVATLILVSH